MASPNRNITIHECFFAEQAKKIKFSIINILNKDSLSVEDTQAIRELTEVYDSLANPVPENYVHRRVGCNSDLGEESQ